MRVITDIYRYLYLREKQEISVINVKFATLLSKGKNDRIWHMILEEKIYAAKKRCETFAGREF